MQIEKNIPIPPVRRTGGGRKPKYPFGQMTVGDSFLVETVEGETLQQARQRISRAAHAYARSKVGELRFSIRSTDDGIRVWRSE